MAGQHTIKQFDVDLENIRNKVMQMGGLVELQLTNAMNGLETGDTALIDAVIEQDHDVNRHEVELDEACTHVIALRQPAAVDLRMVMMVIKTITDLERIGDEAKKIAKMARAIHGSDTGFAPRIHLRPLADQAIQMLRRALDAFARVDPSVSAQIVRQDKAVDEGFKGAMCQLIPFMMEDPRTISSALDLIFVARAIEREGDHAKNISEYVVYMAKGRDVRHIGIEALERQAAE